MHDNIFIFLQRILKKTYLDMVNLNFIDILKAQTFDNCVILIFYY